MLLISTLKNWSGMQEKDTLQTNSSKHLWEQNDHSLVSFQHIFSTTQYDILFCGGYIIILMCLHILNAHIILVITIIVSAVIASIFIFPPNESVRELFGVLSFLYGIFVAFAISNSSARFSKVVEKLETEEAFLLYIYTMSALLGARVQKKTQALIDDYLISQLDHFLKDYRLTYPHFLKIFQFYIKDVRPEKGDELQKEAFENIIDTLKTLMENRKQIELNIQDTMTKLEWVCIGALLR